MSRSAAILRVADVFHPVDDLTVSASAIAICVIAVVGAAPCQCFSPGANQMTSPGRTQSIRADAAGSKVTLAPLTRAGLGVLNSGSMRTVPVNHSDGPFPEGLCAVSLDIHGFSPLLAGCMVMM